MLILIIIITIYLLLIGFITVLERKIIGIVQSRVSILRGVLLGMFQFYLDFLKLLIKGLLDKSFTKMFYYVIILVLFLLNNILFFLWTLFIMFNECFVYYDFLLFIFLDGNVLLFKVYIFRILSNKFVSYNESRVRFLVMVLEYVFIYLLVLIFIIIFFIGDFLYSTFNLFIIILVFISIIILIKSFRTPFDYLECESELVNGISLEFYGHSFLIWSLIEYSTIFNNIFFLSFLFFILFSNNIFYILFLFTLFTFLVLFLRSVFVRIDILSCIFLVINIYCIANLILFIFLIL